MRVRRGRPGKPIGLILSIGYRVLRRVLQLLVLGMRADRSKEVEIPVLRHQRPRPRRRRVAARLPTALPWRQ